MQDIKMQHLATNALIETFSGVSKRNEGDGSEDTHNHKWEAEIEAILLGITNKIRELDVYLSEIQDMHKHVEKMEMQQKQMMKIAGPRSKKKSERFTEETVVPEEVVNGVESKPAGTVFGELCKGEAKIAIKPPVDFRTIRKLQEYLSGVRGLQLVSVSGSESDGTEIIVSSEDPLPLMDVFKKMPLIDQVDKGRNKIQLMLKSDNNRAGSLN